MKNTFYLLILFVMVFNLLSDQCKAETDQNVSVVTKVEAKIKKAFLTKPVELIIVPDHQKKPCCHHLTGELSRQLSSCFFIENVSFVEFYPDDGGCMNYYVQTEMNIGDGRIRIYLEPFKKAGGRWRLEHNRKVLIFYKNKNGKYLILAQIPDKFANLVENFIRDNFKQ